MTIGGNYWNDGYFTAQAGLPLSDCPVSPTSEEGKAWSKGWISGEARRREKEGTYGATPEQHASAIRDLGLDHEPEEWLAGDLNGPVEGLTYAEYEEIHTGAKEAAKYETWYPDDDPRASQPRMHLTQSWVQGQSKVYTQALDPQGKPVSSPQILHGVSVTINPGNWSNPLSATPVVDLSNWANQVKQSFSIPLSTLSDAWRQLIDSYSALADALADALGLDEPKPPHRAWLWEFEWLTPYEPSASLATEWVVSGLRSTALSAFADLARGPPDFSV